MILALSDRVVRFAVLPSGGVFCASRTRATILPRRTRSTAARDASFISSTSFSAAITRSWISDLPYGECSRSGSATLSSTDSQLISAPFWNR